LQREGESVRRIESGEEKKVGGTCGGD